MSKEKSRNERIAEMLSDGEKIKDFYRFTAQNPHIDLHDACQIVIARPKASICFYIDEWNGLGRKVTANRKGIQFYDTDGRKQFMFDLHDTHGDKRYRRLILPMRRLLYGLDELNGTQIAESNRRDYSKILSGIVTYLEASGYFTEDERRNSLIAEGVAYSLYSKTGFPKDARIALRGMPYDLEENARLFKEIYLLTETAREDIEAAYERYVQTPKVIDDIEEETVSDEPVLFGESERMDEPAPTEETPQGNAMYQRYMAAQQEKPEAVVLYRVGDFYEVIGERAREAAERLDLTLTSRDVGLDERVPMCGFPYHVTDTYIEKILEYRGVYIVEPDAEPMYILSQAELTLLPEGPEEERKQPDAEKLAELDALFAPEFEHTAEESVDEQVGTQSDGYEEEESEAAEESEQDTSVVEPNGETRQKTKGKEKSIRERKRPEKPEATLFDYFLPVPEKSREEQLIEKQLLHGSGFQDGKYRIYDKYFTDPTIKEYATFLKNEYGIGGYGYGNESQQHDGKGIRMEWRDREHPENNIRIDLKWNEVAVRIADLIDEDRYLTEEEKKDYEQRYVPEQLEKQRLQIEKQRKQDEFVNRVIREVETSRKQRILDEYAKTTHLADFAEFLNIEYGYSSEARENYLARYDPNGVWLSQYDTSGTTELRVYLSWIDFANKVCDLIEADCYIDDGQPQETEIPEPPKTSENTDLNEVLDQSEFGGAKSRYRGNVEAIRLMKDLYWENRAATSEERKVLVKYVGWGGLAQVFDEANEQWSKEYGELKSLLSAEEYERAKGSVLNAHYTSKEVIAGIYAALERFGVKGNNRILEPALGTGNFFGYMPATLSAGASLYGVELDEVTGKIAAKLYPQAKIQIKGFEETSFPPDYFDVVVSNVPFGGYGVYDSEYSRQKFMIHDYFIAKSIDRVRPNGIVAVVTSKGTLDKLNPAARKYMAERAELLGAIRLPNTAFKQTANTEAVTDILFFQKRNERIADTSGIDWLGTGKTAEGYEVNNYFINHPEMVLGTFAKEMGLYGAEGVTVKPDGRDLSTALNAAISSLPQNIYMNPDSAPDNAEETELTEIFNVRPMCYVAMNGKLYIREGEKLVEQEVPAFPKDAYERIREMISLRNELRYVLEIQTARCSDETLASEQRRLNADYDRFVRKYGLLNSQTNARLFRDDGDAALLFSCENLSEDKTRATKADVFTKRTIRPYAAITHTSDTLEALQICRNEQGKVDIGYIEGLTGKEFDTVIEELGESVYRNPVMVEESDKYSGYQTAEDYLSGKVVEKLRIAREYAKRDESYLRNVSALERVQPEPLKAEDIAVRIGASWVDAKYYKQFLMQLLVIEDYYSDGLTIRYNRFDGSWKVERADYVRKSAGYIATEKYGTERANAFRLFEDCLNQRATSVYDTIEEDGKVKQVLNQAETIAAREKQNKIKEEFADWIYAEPSRREDLERTYNQLFNQIRLPSYDGSYLKFPGMNPAIELRPHQKNAIARIAGTGNSTLLHHVVGSGKSFTMAASAMKLRQYGLAKKPMIVVPNHLVQQMANEFRRLYPQAKILVTQKEDLEKNNRKRFVSKVAMGDWDSIIIAQSSFAKIPVSQERQENMIRREIAKIEEAILKMRKENTAISAVKNLERIKKGRETMLKKLTDSGKKDNVLIFESLGVDYLFVDEADAYKNLFLYTKMNNVSGISNAASARASDMQMKIEYINELHGGDKGVVFATGTPISNSMAEMYVMQTYLQRNTLEELGIHYFDAWAADFGETVTALEMAPSGQGYRARTRFAKFTNLPELMTLYRSFADVQTSDMVKLDVPEAERITITLEPSEQTVRIAEDIAKRAETIYRGGVDPHIDNMLKVTSDGKKLALDVRCFDSFLKDEGQGKLEDCADNAVKVYEETQDIRGTQLIFCDMSTPKKPYESYEYGKDFDVYNDLKYKLIERGVPKDEIAFIHDAKTDKEKQALFDKMNEGKIRILIGSTEKCGAGTNVQKRLAALHHLDAPYRPRDLQQRDGRGIRQGNLNDRVQIFTYVKKRTLDSYCYQILENKQRFISQIENGSLTVREAEDIDETTLSYAEIKAITAANPKIKRKMELETELTRLRVLEGQYKKNLYALQDKVLKELPMKIRQQENLLQHAQEDETNMRAKYSAEVFSINVLGTVYTDKKAGAAALMDALRANQYETPVAEYGGFQISLMPPRMIDSSRSVTLKGNGCYSMEIGESELGLITRLDNFMNDFPDKKKRFASQLEQLQRDLAVAEEELKKPFEHRPKIEALTNELAQINAELDLNKREEVVMDTEEENEEEKEVNYMALPEREQYNPEKRSHRWMTERLYEEYTAQKARLPDAVILIKNGEYYETVGTDAERLSEEFDLTMYQKTLGGETRTVAMLGYDDLDRVARDFVAKERDLEIVEQIAPSANDMNFLETEEEAEAIANHAESELLPDYGVNEELTEQASRFQNGMYPISRSAAKRYYKLGLTVYDITNGRKNVLIEKEFDTFPGIFGVDKNEWRTFLRTDTAAAYFAARLCVADAAQQVLSQDLSYVDAKYVDTLSDAMYPERMALNEYVKDMPDAEAMRPYLKELIDEYSGRLSIIPLEHYGWDEESVPYSIAMRIEHEELKQFAVDLTFPKFDVDEELRRMLAEIPADERELLHLPDLNGRPTVMEIEPPKLLTSNSVYLTGIMLLRGDTDGKWYVVENELINHENGKRLAVGDSTNVKTVLAYTGFYNGNPLREFRSETEARAYFEDKIAVTRGGDRRAKENRDFGMDPENIVHVENINAVVKNVRTALERLQEDPTTVRAGFKERFYAAFTEFIEDASEDIFDLDFAELRKDGEELTDRVYSYYMNSNDQINIEDWHELAELTKNYIDNRGSMREEVMETSIYRGTREEAVKRGEERLYRQSWEANIECKYAIEQAIRENFDGRHLNKGFEKNLIEQYGMERVAYVLAATVQDSKWDGRYSPETKKWAQSIVFYENEEDRRQFHIDSHPAVLDGLIVRIRAAEKAVKETLHEGGEMQEGKYRTETLRGLPVVSIERDKYGHDIAIVKRKDDFVVAIGYNVNDGTWAQGRYDFSTQDAAQEFIDKNYKAKGRESRKWLTAKVSRDALIRRYDRHSFFRMPNGEYEEYTYNVFNNRVKDSRQLVDSESDGHELCYELIFPADDQILIKNREGEEVEMDAEAFIELINGTSDRDYERAATENKTAGYAITVPQEALRGTYEKSSLFAMPTTSEFAGFSYYIPIAFVEEDKSGEEGNIVITLPEDFHVTLRNRKTSEQLEISAMDLYDECNQTKSEDYARASENSQDVSKPQIHIVIPEKARIAAYENQTMFKMPKTSEYAGYCFYLFNNQLEQRADGIHANLSEDFTVYLRDNQNARRTELNAKEFGTIMRDKTDKDFKGVLTKPSEEKRAAFQEREELMRKNLPQEMLERPNWVAVVVFQDKAKGKLLKLQIDPKTGNPASPYEPSTWSDFGTACQYAKENGCVALAYALDGKDRICCIDIDHCFNANRQLSDEAKEVWKASEQTYREVSVSRNGLHIFGKTDGLGLQVYSDAGDMEFYERGKFMTITGDAFNNDKNLLNFDEMPIKDILLKRFSKHKEYSGIGKGIEGLASMSDRDVIERACAAKHGDTFQALYNGEDLQNNRSNSDMALMTRLAFWCNGDKHQMLRIFATSGLYRPDKSPEYYEHTALKAVRENPNRFEPRVQSASPKPSAARHSDGKGR